MTERIEAQVERFAPGFRDRILARAVRSPAQLEHDNPNYIGGDINGGIQDWRQLFTRPVAKIDPVRDAHPRALPLLVVDSAGWRRARHVRRLGRAIGAEAGVRDPRLTIHQARARVAERPIAGTASGDLASDRPCRQDHEQDGHAGQEEQVDLDDR